MTDLQTAGVIFAWFFIVAPLGGALLGKVIHRRDRQAGIADDESRTP